jgi:hypothetical protein
MTVILTTQSVKIINHAGTLLDAETAWRAINKRAERNITWGDNCELLPERLPSVKGKRWKSD